MMLLAPRRRRQPLIPAKIDWSNPLTRGLAFVVNPGAGIIYDAISRVVVQLGANVSYDRCINDRALYFNGSQSNGAVSWGSVTTFNSATQLTVAMVGMNGGSGTEYKWVSMWPDTFLLETSSGGYGRFFLKNSASANCSWLSDNGGIAANDPFVLSASCAGGTSGVMMFNDVLSQPTSAASFDNLPASTTSNLQLGVANDGTPGTGWVSLALVLLRAWSIPEHLSFSRNPWQLFAPLPRQIWIPSGLTNPALSSAAATNVAQTTADLQVTITFS